MEIFLTVIHIFVSIVLILSILLQSGKGGGMGSALGGASAQVFGGRGAGTFLSKFTTFAAIVFMCTSLTLSMMGSDNRSVVKGALQKQAPAPAVDAAPAEAIPAEAIPAEAKPAEAKPAEAPAE
jgi:preprotein translocase subunit SecG